MIKTEVQKALSLFAVVLVASIVHADQENPELLATSGSYAHKEWPLVNGDLRNSRYSTLDQITINNIENVGGAWVSDEFKDAATSRSTPVVQNGRMFLNAGSRVYALDAKTGKTLWTWESGTGQKLGDIDQIRGLVQALNEGIVLPNAAGNALGEGKVFVGLMDGSVIALSQDSGKLLWRTQTGEDPPQLGQAVSGAPTYVNGVVFAGLANGDWALRGRVTAIEARTGKQLWQFFVVPAPGQEGFETWPQNSDVWERGGGGVWQAGVVDPDLGLVFYGTGNAVPPQAGELRPGDNLFTSSVVALDIKTGQLRWHYQLVHHDLWEADLATPLILYDARSPTGIRKGVAAMRPDGYLFLLDRVNGIPLMPIEERPVPQSAELMTSATQPFPVGADNLLGEPSQWEGHIPAGFVLGEPFSPPSLPPPSQSPQNVLTQGFFGMRMLPMSYSPQTGFFYAMGTAKLNWDRRADGSPYILHYGRVPPGIPAYSVIGAIDSRTNKVVWKRDGGGMLFPQGPGGGAMTTAGGLMFVSRPDGNFEAYDAMTGDLLWQFQMGYTGGRGAASTYEIDGEQYVVVSAGPVVRSFKLGGQLEPQVALPGPSRDELSSAGPIQYVDVIETASLGRNGMLGGHGYFIDEFAFSPAVARVQAGTRLRFINNGKMRHTIAALDESWTTGPLSPAEAGYITFEKPGSHTYICEEHPWSYGQIIVSDEDIEEIAKPGGDDSFGEQVGRGKEQYMRHCAACHSEDLGGRDPAPPMIGETFALRWQGRTVGELFDRTRSTMPQSAPGSLSQDSYLDIVAFLLQSNGQSSASALTGDPSKLQQTTIGEHRR